MTKNSKSLHQYLSQVKVWAVVAVLGAMVLLAWYGLHGFQYWQAWSGIRSMTSQSQIITTSLNQSIPEKKAVAWGRDVQEQELARLQTLFYYPDIGQLMSTISRTAWENDVDLASIGADDPMPERLGDMEYQVQAMTLGVGAPPEDLYRFLAVLHAKVPIMGVSSITMINPGPDARAEIQLVFYLSPRPVPDDEGAD